MKKITVLPLLFIVILLAACQTAPVQKEPFTPTLRSQSIPVGEVEMQFDRAFPLPGIRKINSAVLYFPEYDAVVLNFRKDMMNYHLFFRPEAREMFASSLAKYKEDFDSRNFGRTSRKSRRKYGFADSYVFWQLTTISTLARGESIIDFGYHFAEKAPYFTITQRQVDYTDPLSISDSKTLSVMSMYFTRAQADELLAMFDEELLSNISTANPLRIMTPEIDQYDD